MQCDIDILGEPSNLAEIELILATTTLLGRVGFRGFKVHVNDRRILKAMASYSGFAPEDFDNVFIELDKMDKIGLDGVCECLTEDGFSADAIAKYRKLFEEFNTQENRLDFLKATLGDFIEENAADNLMEILSAVEASKGTDCEVVFDPTLVRGMSYYTGTIFEIEMKELNCSVAGGGRYDKMIGKFTGQDTPACGFSIGFERIITIMMEQGKKAPGTT
jgi:histidyl-tRNA synthetase